MQTTKIAGYTYGTKAVSKSPVSLEELERLKQTVTLSDTDVHHLRLAGDVLEDQTEEVINAWRGVIGNTPHLARYFTAPNGNPDENYKARAKERFKQWILDVCRRPYDQDWLDYQQEIGLRHTHLKKNQTDGAPAPPQIPPLCDCLHRRHQRHDQALSCQQGSQRGRSRNYVSRVV